MSKLPTALEVFNKHTNQRMMHEPYIIAAMQEYAESHTAAHTAALRERVKELEASIKEAIDILESQLFNEYKVSSAHEELCNALKKVES